MKTMPFSSILILISLILSPLFSIPLIAQSILTAGKHIRDSIKIIQQDEKSVTLEISVPDSVVKACLEEASKTVNSKEDLQDMEYGIGNIAIPLGAVANLKVLDCKKSTFVRTSENNHMNIDFTENLMPAREIAFLSEEAGMRGIDIKQIKVSLLHYDTETRKLTFYNHVKIEIDFMGGTGMFCDNRLRNRWWEPILTADLINYKSLLSLNPDHSKRSNTKETGADYLIISPDAPVFKQWADSIRLFRTTQGILTKVVTLNGIGGSTASAIEAFIDQAYTTWDIPPVAVLLLGDYGTNPQNSVISPVWDNYCVSDNIYGDVDGDDLPDIAVARICAQNAGQLETMVAKFLNYEENPTVDTSFYNHPITSTYFQSGGIQQIVTESVAGFYETILGKNTNRINTAPLPLPNVWTTSPEGQALANYFGPSGLGYIPATPAGINCNWTGTAQDFMDGINSGAFMVLYLGNGSENGWASPSFNISDLTGLINQNPVFVWSVASLSGKFNTSGDCFAEVFHRQVNGALGVVAPSEISYSIPDDIYTMGAFDYMWPDYLPDTTPPIPSPGVLPAFANAAGKYFLSQNSWPLNPQTKKVTMHTIHYFGDAFSTVYTEIPQNLTVIHPDSLLAGDSNFTIQANEGALIGLSVNGEFLAMATGTGNFISIPITPQYPPDQMLVTVTKQNYFRYEAEVTIINEIEAGFTVSENEPCVDDTVAFTDLSAGDITTWDWIFEGGIPPVSTQQNPTAHYPGAGVFDVTLIVSDGLNSDTLIKNNFITVHEIPSIPATPEGENYPSSQPGMNYTYYIPEVEDATQYNWIADPPEAIQSMIVDDTACTVDFSDWWEGTLSLKVSAENECGESGFSDALPVYVTFTGKNEKKLQSFNVYPNPAKDKIIIDVNVLNLSEEYRLTMFDSFGREVLDKFISTGNSNSFEISTKDFDKGCYIIKFENSSCTHLTRIIIR